MSFYEEAKTKAKVGSELSDEFSVKVGVHQAYVLSLLLLAMVVDEVTENARKDGMQQILYAGDLVLMEETLEELRENFDEWREAFESKGMRESQSWKGKVDNEWDRKKNVCQYD